MDVEEIPFIIEQFNVIMEIFHSEMGLPQGSVLISSIVVQHFYNRHVCRNRGNHCKFADDGTFWHSGEHVQKLMGKNLQIH